MGVNFYPRPPRGGRPLPFRAYAKVWNISIHALREEGDRGLLFQHRPCNDFYPRPPRGGRQQHECHRRRSGGFLSTPSARRATWCGGCDITPMTISIHALREEGDVVRHHADFIRYDFYPRPPRGGRLRLRNHAGGNHEFLSTPSARRATAKTETKSLFSNKLYNILHEFRRALIYNGSKNYPNHAKRLENPVRRCRKNAENSPFAPGRETQNNSRPSCSKGG